MKTISYTPGKALNETEGLSLIASYLRSGLSSSAFYKQIGMSEKTFYKWRKYYMRHQSSDRQEAEANVASCRFFPIEVLPEENSRDRESGSVRTTDYIYEVEFSNGIRVRMQDSSGAEHLLCICNGLK
jgi:transposase-like protein